MLLCPNSKCHDPVIYFVPVKHEWLQNIFKITLQSQYVCRYKRNQKNVPKYLNYIFFCFVQAHIIFRFSCLAFLLSLNSGNSIVNKFQCQIFVIFPMGGARKDGPKREDSKGTVSFFFCSVSFCSANPGKVTSSLSEVEVFLRLTRKLWKLFVQLLSL